MKALTPRRLLTLPLLALAAMPACKRNTDARMDPDWWKLEADRVELVQEVKLQKMRLAGRDLSKEYGPLAAKVDANALKLEELRQTASALRGEVTSLVDLSEKQRREWVLSTRAEAIGRTYDSFAGSNGRIYEDVVITRITDVGIEFRHSTGSARVSAAELNPDLHDDFAVNPQVAIAAMEKERANASAYESWISDRMVVANAERKASEREAAAEEAERIVASARARSEARSSLLASTERNTRLRDEPRSVGNRYTTWYPNYSYGYGYTRNRYYGTGCYRSPYYGAGSNASCFGVSVTPRCGNTPMINPVYTPTRNGTGPVFNP